MRYPAIIITVTVLVVSAMAAGPAPAQQMRLGVYGDPIVECDFGLPAPFNVGQAHIIVKRSVDFLKVRFTSPVPACNGIVFLSDTSPIGVFTGNSQSGVEVTMPACQTNVFSPVEIFTISFIMTGTGTDMCEWIVEPFPGDPYIVMEDCDGVEARAAGNGAGQINMGNQSVCWLVGEDNVIVGYRPSIADGATGVPVNPTLDWVGPATSLLLATHPLDVPIPGHEHFTADAVPSLTQPYHPATLDPNTTYYWQLRHDECCTFEPGMAVGEIWSFTTEEAISTESSTWSQIKALYQ